jgi:hypothetical protein
MASSPRPADPSCATSSALSMSCRSRLRRSGVMRALLAAGMPVRQINPFKLRQFARASGVLAKNDPLDARMIASFVTITADTSGAAAGASSRTAGRDARRSPPAQRRESRCRECLQAAGRCDAAASFSPRIFVVLHDRLRGATSYVSCSRRSATSHAHEGRFGTAGLLPLLA